MKKQKYNVVFRILIILLALFYLIGGFDAILEVRDGETTWSALQISRTVFSLTFAGILAALACFTQKIDERLKLGLRDNWRFLFVLFVTIAITLTSIIVFPAH